MLHGMSTEHSTMPAAPANGMLPSGEALKKSERLSESDVITTAILMNPAAGSLELDTGIPTRKLQVPTHALSLPKKLL